MSSPRLWPISSIPWTTAAAVMCTVYAYGTLAGSRLDGLLLLGAITVQGRRHWASHVTALDHIQTNETFSLVLGLIVVSCAIYILKKDLRRDSTIGGSASPLAGPPLTPARWTGPGQPLLFPCITTHTRLFPKMHSFAYSYLVVGIPVGWSGTSGGMISSSGPGPESAQRKGWFHVDANDYLERGNRHLGLRGKLEKHLREMQGVDPAQYPHAYLVTAARFLGYHFNPVSLWYLYNANRTLAAMLLEVNNTFGERRMYYLTLEALKREQYSNGENDENGTSNGASRSMPLLFKQKWPKDFHVSPFNSRKGSYELLANDPLAPNMQGTGPITATIVLRSSHEHSKIVARLVSERRDVSKPNGSPIAMHSFDPAAMSAWQRVRFLAGWWWVGFVTFPRIVKQAGVLFFQKKLHVWFRPEPLETSMGRLADATEQTLEAVFRPYLRHLVDNASSAMPFSVRYIPSGLPKADAEVFYSPAAKKSMNSVGDSDGIVNNGTPIANPAAATEIEFRVLTPVFYSRFVHYAHDVEAFFCELHESSTVSVSPPEAVAVFTKQVLARPAPLPPLQVTSPVDYVAFKAIQKLRRRPERIERPLTWPQNIYTSSASSSKHSDVRGFRLSAMDGFVLSLGEENGDLRKSYRSTVLRLFLADRTAFGLVPLLRMQWLVLRVAIAWFAAQGLLCCI